MPKLSSDTLRNVVVVVASCTISFFIYGTARLSGLLFLACRERYNVGRKEASLPFVLSFTLRNLSGPFAGYLGNKFGLRCVTLLGGLLSAVAIGLCFFVEDIILITVLWGGVFGVGFGIGSILITNILHMYFKANFNRMHGIFLASGCLGGFVLPGIAETLLNTYGTSGTFLILSGLVLQCVPAAMLLKNPEESPKIQIHSKVEEMDNTVRISKEINNSSIENTFTTTSLNKSTCNNARNEGYDKFADRVEICYTSSNANDDPNLSAKNILKTPTQAIPDSTTHVVRKDHKNPATSQPQTISRNLQVFLDPVYILILISISIAIVVLLTQYTIIVDACRDKGITEDVTILMTFSISEMLGRAIFGYVADADCISSLNIFVSCCVSCGFLLIGFIWLKDLYALLIFIVGMGVLFGGFMVVPAGIIKDYIEKENLTMAFSSRYFLFGLLNISQPSVIGYFRDTLHSYDGLYYLLGSMCLLSAVTSLLIPSAVRLRHKRRNKTKDTDESVACNISQK